MKIEKIIIEGFRSFGERQELYLNNMTTIVGGNGVGKTSLLIALNRFFGNTQKDRQVVNEDFYLSVGQTIDDVAERKFSIEVKIIFPELIAEDLPLESVAECFRNMTIDAGERSIPYIRLRLVSTYTRDRYGEGDIKSNAYWIRDSYGTTYEVGEEEQKAELSAADRQRIRVIYTPASRDPQVQLKEFSGSLIGGFVKSINWTTSPEVTLRTAVDSVKESLDIESGVRVINEVVTNKWTAFSSDSRTSKPKLSFIDDDVKKMLKSVSMSFSGEHVGSNNSELGSLSDGEKSLFYFSLLHSALNLKNFFVIDEEVQIGEEYLNLRASFDEEKLQFPSLTILAIEEPENHLSPHHFGQLIESFKGIASAPSSQIIFSSHSPSIIRRVQPEDIRYIRLSNHCSVIKAIQLPPAEDLAFTYVKEAVRAYPELYFSKIIVLGEGDSEEVVFRKFFEAKGLPLDRSMISVVPLGGRYVNHFWRLLYDLGIPFVTLLDLDLGKKGAGWGRIKYCIQQLIEIGNTFEEITDGDLTNAQFQVMQDWIVTEENYHSIESWINHFEDRYDIYFSRKLDLDMMMLESFFANYTATIQAPNTGPRGLPLVNDPNFQLRLNELKKVIFDDENIPNFYDPSKLNYYRYLFLGKGKPLTHSMALNSIEAEAFLTACPEVLINLGNRVSAILSPEVEENEDDEIEDDEIEDDEIEDDEIDFEEDSDTDSDYLFEIGDVEESDDEDF